MKRYGSVIVSHLRQSDTAGGADGTSLLRLGLSQMPAGGDPFGNGVTSGYEPSSIRWPFHARKTAGMNFTRFITQLAVCVYRPQ